MIPENAKTAIYEKRGHGIFLNLDLQKTPCKGYAKYQGARSPICGCRLCVEKFIEIQLVKGTVFFFSNLTMRELFTGAPE